MDIVSSKRGLLHLLYYINHSPQTDEGVKALVQADVATRAAATVRIVLCLMIELSIVEIMQMLKSGK